MSSLVPNDSLRRTWPALLMLCVIVLLPVGQGSEAPLVIGAIVGLVWIWRDRAALRGDERLRLPLILFACYWLPALCSAVDAEVMGESWKTTVELLRFLPFALFAILALGGEAELWPRLILAIAAIVVLWLLDAWVQIFTGYSLAGAMEKERVSGIFGAQHLKLGQALAVLAPFVLYAARALFGRAGLAAAFAFLLIPILLAGSRAAWLMYALVALVFVWRETRKPLRFVAWSLAAVAAMGVAALIADRNSPAFDARVQRSLLVLQGSERALDEASAGRLRIWGTALRMSAAHPINGVGVRGFRYAYATYARAGDNFVDAHSDEGAAHAHQLLLEVLSETGTLGLLFWGAGAACAIRAWRRASALARERAFAPGLALAAMCFPLNTHLAFYSAWWGLLFWWLLALFCAALSTAPTESQGSLRKDRAND